VCDWCSNEINGITDKVHESKHGTLCDMCEKARIEEEEMYKEEREQARLEIVIKKEKERLMHGDKQGEGTV